jgi:hypothetical protein
VPEGNTVAVGVLLTLFLTLRLNRTRFCVPIARRSGRSTLWRTITDAPEVAGRKR